VRAVSENPKLSHRGLREKTTEGHRGKLRKNLSENHDHGMQKKKYIMSLLCGPLWFSEPSVEQLDFDVMKFLI
jgi:hypothetical protein